jgi:hypothetical protein
MARIILHLLKSDDCSSTTFNDLVEFIQSEVKSKLFETHTAKPRTKTSFTLSSVPSFQEYFAISDAYRAEHNIRPEDFIFVVSEKSNQMGFFCALGDGDSRAGFIHAKSWKHTYPDLSTRAEACANAYLIYSLVLRRFQYSAADYSSYYEVFATAPFVHRDSKPCFNNWVVEKRKIETLLSSVYICPACNKGIIEGGLSAQHLAVIKKLFEKIREKVLANEETDPFENGLVYVYQNRIEIRYEMNNNFVHVPFSAKLGDMSYFVFYLYLLLINRTVRLSEWKDDASHFELMRRIVGLAQGSVLTQPLAATANERYEEMTLLKKYGTPVSRNSIEYQNSAIATLVSRVNATFTHGFQQFQPDEIWAKQIAKEYFIKGTRELVLGLNRNRVYFADSWMDAFSEEFEWMQRM